MRVERWDQSRLLVVRYLKVGQVQLWACRWTAIVGEKMEVREEEKEGAKSECATSEVLLLVGVALAVYHPLEKYNPSGTGSAAGAF